MPTEHTFACERCLEDTDTLHETADLQLLCPDCAEAENAEVQDIIYFNEDEKPYE